MTKKFSERSKKGKRNTVIFYCVVGIIVVLFFLLLNTFPEMNNSNTAHNSPDSGKTDSSSTITPITNNNPMQDQESFCQLSEFQFVSEMLSLIGAPVVEHIADSDTSSVTINDFLLFGIRRLGDELSKTDFAETAYDDLRIGDIGVCDFGYGFYLGKFENNAVFLVAPPIGNILSIDEPQVGLSFDAESCDNLFYGAYPTVFTKYYHLKSSSYSDDCGIDFSVHVPETSQKDMEYASRLYEFNKYFRSKDFTSASSMLNTRVAKLKNYYFNPDLYADCFLGLLSEIEEEFTREIKDVYLSVSSLYPTSNGCVIRIAASFIDNKQVLTQYFFDHTFYSNGTYLPFDVLTEPNFSKYGFTHLNSGEELVPEEALPEAFVSGSGYLIQKDDGSWVLRGNGYEQDVTDLINNTIN